MTKNKLPDGTDNFEESMVSDFLGYVSSIDPTKVSPSALVRGSINVYKKISGTIANRPGRKQYDGVDNTLAGVDSHFVWHTSLGATLILEVTNGKLRVYSNAVWLNLQTGLTLTRYVFETIWDNTLKKDFLVFVRGDSNLFRWDGGIGAIASTTSNTIVLSTTVASAGFNTTSGSVVINGTTYTYSGSSASTLTGVSGDPSGEANGSTVASAVITNATTPVSTFTNDFIKVNKNQLGVGSYSSRLFYISKSSSYIDYSQSTPRIPGDGELLTLDNLGKGVAVRNGNFWVSSDAEWYEQSFTQITVGTTLTEQTKVDKKPSSPAYSHEMIDVDNDVIIYLSADQQLKTIGNYRNLSSTAFPTLSQEIFDELQQEDFTLGQLKVIKDFIYLVAPNNGRAYLHQSRVKVDAMGNVVAERLWHSPFIWGISRIDVADGDTVGFSNSNPQMYYLWDTGQWHDDAPDTVDVLNLPYQSVALFGYQNAGRRQGKIQFDKAYYEGYVLGNLYEAVYYDYQGATNLLTSIINSAEYPATTFTGVLPPSLGDASLGDNPLGSGLNTLPDDQALLPKFRVIIGKEVTDCFEFEPMVYSNEVDVRWELLALGFNISLATVLPVEIVKQD